MKILHKIKQLDLIRKMKKATPKSSLTLEIG